VKGRLGACDVVQASRHQPHCARGSVEYVVVGSAAGTTITLYIARSCRLPSELQLNVEIRRRQRRDELHRCGFTCMYDCGGERKGRQIREIGAWYSIRKVLLSGTSPRKIGVADSAWEREEAEVMDGPHKRMSVGSRCRQRKVEGAVAFCQSVGDMDVVGRKENVLRHGE
jgi:hypothetical protein